VDDPARVRVRETFQHLRGCLDRSRVVQLAGPERLAQRLSGHVLVGDVDVARVALEAVRAQAALVPKPRCGQGLPFGPCGSLALARDDLQRDVEPVSLVSGEPDRAGAAAPERPQRTVAPGNELVGRGS